MEHDLAVHQHGTFSGFSRGEDAGAHTGGHADAGCGHIAAEESHGVDDSKSRRDAAAGGVDVELDIGFGIVVGEKKELRDDRVGGFIGDGAAEDDNAVLEEAGVDVVGAFSSAAFFNDDGDELVDAHSCVRLLIAGPLNDL